MAPTKAPTVSRSPTLPPISFSLRTDIPTSTPTGDGDFIAESLADCNFFTICNEATGVSIALFIIAFLAALYTLLLYLRRGTSAKWPFILAGLALFLISMQVIVAFAVNLVPYQTAFAPFRTLGAMALSFSMRFLFHGLYPLLPPLRSRVILHLGLMLYTMATIPLFFYAFAQIIGGIVAFFLFINFASIIASICVHTILNTTRKALRLADPHNFQLCNRLLKVETAFITNYMCLNLVTVIQLLQIIQLTSFGANSIGNYMVTYFFFMFFQITWALIVVSSSEIMTETREALSKPNKKMAKRVSQYLYVPEIKMGGKNPGFKSSTDKKNSDKTVTIPAIRALVVTNPAIQRSASPPLPFL